MKSQKRTKQSNISQPLFADHLEKLELLSLATRRITGQLPRNANAEKTLSLMWDILSQSIPSGGTADINELSTLSSIIQRTAAATKQMQSLEDDSVDLVRKVVDFESTRHSLIETLRSITTDTEPSADITPQTIALIERRLRLL